MSPSHDPGYDDHTLTEYLLGRLPEQEAERIDEESLIEESLSWQLRVVEEDLIDAYVRGTLDGETKALFEASYLTSERRRAKVQFATDFLATIDRAGATVPAPRAEEATAAGLLASDASRAARRSPIWLLAAAAAIVIGVGGFGWYQQTRLRQELTLAQQDRNALDRRVRDLERELTDQRAGRAQASTDLARVRTPGPGAAAATTDSAASPAAAGADATSAATLALAPQTRGAGSIDRLLLPAAGTPATFALRLESSDFRRYRAALRDPGSGRVVWRSAAVSPTPGTPVTVSIAVPAGVLKFQHYAIELSGLGATGLAGIVATYAFEVAQR
jgi:hypothetical protein